MLTAKPAPLPSRLANPSAAVTAYFDDAFGASSSCATGGDVVESTPAGVRLSYSETTAVWLADVINAARAAELAYRHSLFSKHAPHESVDVLARGATTTSDSRSAPGTGENKDTRVTT